MGDLIPDSSILQILGPLGGVVGALLLVWRLSLRVEDDMTARYQGAIEAFTKDVDALRDEVHRLQDAEIRCQRQLASVYSLLAVNGISSPTPPNGISPTAADPS